MIYLFDIDGTLTPSYEEIEPEMKDVFMDFCERNTVYVCSGMTWGRMAYEQLGLDICINGVSGAYPVAGNEFWKDGELVYRNHWAPSIPLIHELLTIHHACEFPDDKKHKDFDHIIDRRSGMMNFCIPDKENHRKEWIEWDTRYGHRKYTRQRLLSAFPDLDVRIAGETGLDIFPKGKDKSQIITHLRGAHPKSEIMYIGDQIFPGGNDYDVAMAADKVISVGNWNDTYTVCCQLMNRDCEK